MPKPALRQARWRPLAGPVFLLAVVLSVLLIWSTAGPAFADPSKTERVKRDYVVEYMPSAAVASQLTLARQSLNRVDEDSLNSVAGFSAETGVLLNAYDSLHAAASSAANASGRWLVEGIPASIMRAFEEGNVPESAVRRAAENTGWLGEDEEAPADALIVYSVDTEFDSEQFTLLLNDFNVAVDSLDGPVRSLVEGSADYAGMDDDLLRSLAEEPNPVGAEAQLELDHRLSESLPDLSSASNGQLDPALLCPIPWDPSHSLLCASMGNFERLNAEYKEEFGTDLPILSGYRTLERQYIVHQRSPGMTAIPGTSNHGLGQAVDFDWDVFANWDDPEVIWMIENGPRFGFRHPSVLGPTTDRPEPWHYEFGTSYTGVDSEDFQGPTPQVIYRVMSPWN